jgi:pimeloyl-ACP methyl ester carboxylesterase
VVTAAFALKFAERTERLILVDAAGMQSEAPELPIDLRVSTIYSVLQNFKDKREMVSREDRGIAGPDADPLGEQDALIPLSISDVFHRLIKGFDARNYPAVRTSACVREACGIDSACGEIHRLKWSA